tara:strand:+ start:113 stop:1393 length:1281 start_codon:yes stop_codon:yes gene_type:complete
MGKHSRKDIKNSKDNDDHFNKNENLSSEKYNLISIIFFIPAFIIILLSIVSIIFPALIISRIGVSDFLEPFEIGILGIPLIVINVIIISIVILHFKNLLPQIFESTIQKILSFDLSQKNSLIFLIIILGIYIAVSVNELSIYEAEQYGDYFVMEKAIDLWPNTDTQDNKYLTEQLSRHVRMALLVVSDEIFDNVKVIPFLASIFLLITTYFLSIKFSKKNITGLISVILVLQSSTFLIYDTIAVYENFWALFYVFSIYLILKNSNISAPFYLLSIFSKAITVLMFPISIIISLLSDISRKRKLISISMHSAVLIISLTIFQYSDTIYSNVININSAEFWTGFTTLAFNLRFDIVLLLFLLPVTIGLFLKAKNGCRNSISLIVLICGTILVTPVLEMLTDFYFVYPYRYIPLIVFFAVGASSLFSKK